MVVSFARDRASLITEFSGNKRESDLPVLLTPVIQKDTPFLNRSSFGNYNNVYLLKEVFNPYDQQESEPSYIHTEVSR